MAEQEKQENIKLPFVEANDATMEELLKAGVHFGHRTQRWHPSMKEYIYTSREGIHIIDLVKTIDKLNEAIEAVYNYSTKGEILFVGTKQQIKEAVKAAAIRSKSHFVVNRWAGGLLTNYLITRKSIKKLNDYVRGFKEGIENRTKKELVKMKEELAKLDILYGGVKTFNKRPAAIVVIDPKKSQIAVREASKMGIPVIALIDTNASVEGVTHVIPANDDAISSVEFVINKLAEAISLGNKGIGAEFSEIDYDEVEESIQNMAKKLEEKRMTARTGIDTSAKGGPRVIRVSREQAKKFVKQR
jgi:small subunit ribosomal protein S2